VGKNQRYRARKQAYFWMKPGFYWVRRELMLVHSRGQEYPNSNHFIEAHSFTALGAISINKLLALMTINDSMNRAAFVVFIEKNYFFNYGPER
jgi:hypothetical protein